MRKICKEIKNPKFLINMRSSVTKYIAVLCTLLMMGFEGYAQRERSSTIYDTIPFALQNLLDKPLTFQGQPVHTFTNWCLSQIQYPEEAMAHNITGRVTLQFIIDTAGVVSDVRVKRSAHPLLDNEAVRVISSSPAWDRVTVKGKKANVRFTFPVVFDLRKKSANDTSIVHARFNYNGHTDFMSWVAENVIYPKKAAKEGYTGKVAVAFDISAEGYVKNVRVLTPSSYLEGKTSSSRQSLAASLDAEAVRVVSSSPRWTPAMKNGMPIKVSYNVLVVFQTE